MTVNDAIDYVRNRYATIRALPNNLVKQHQQLTFIRNAATAAGNMGAAKDAQLRMDEAMSDLKRAQSVNTQLDEVMDAYASVKQAIGLGVVPVLPVAAGVLLVTLVATVGYLLKAYDTRSMAIQALAKGTLTPAQFAQFAKAENATGVTGWLSDAKNLVLLGLGVFVAMAVLRYAPTRRAAT